MHRMFVACPIPREPAEQLTHWASDALSGLRARVLGPEHLHATLFFYAAVDDATRHNLAAWTSAAIWEPLRVRVGPPMQTRGTAAAWSLEGDPAALKRMQDRMARTPGDELWHLCVAQGEADLEKLRRRIPRAGPPALHVTLARLPRRAALPLLPKAPSIEFVLDRIALFESTLQPGGSRYEIVAESRP